MCFFFVSFLFAVNYKNHIKNLLVVHVSVCNLNVHCCNSIFSTPTCTSALTFIIYRYRRMKRITKVRNNTATASLAKVSVFTLLLAFGSSAFAESPACGDPKDASWLEPDVIKEQVESLGYTINSMDVSEGNCYQMTGLNSDGNNVMAYIDPRTGSVLQEDIVQ